MLSNVQLIAPLSVPIPDLRFISALELSIIMSPVNVGDANGALVARAVVNVLL